VRCLARADGDGFSGKTGTFRVELSAKHDLGVWFGPNPHKGCHRVWRPTVRGGEVVADRSLQIRGKPSNKGSQIVRVYLVLVSWSSLLFPHATHSLRSASPFTAVRMRQDPTVPFHEELRRALSPSQTSKGTAGRIPVIVQQAETPTVHAYLHHVQVPRKRSLISADGQAPRPRFSVVFAHHSGLLFLAAIRHLVFLSGAVAISSGYCRRSARLRTPSYL
jgi:hypothetical protein